MPRRARARTRAPRRQPRGAADGAADAEPDPFKVLEALQAENVDLKDRSLRTLAEMENLRRSYEREVTDAKAYGVTSFAREMLTFGDNLRRAIEAVPAQARESAEPVVRSFVEGIELTERDFLSRLARFGIKKMDPLGKSSTPNQHEVLFEMPDESVPTGTVRQVVEPGYTIGDRTLRAAKVGVSRGGPKDKCLLPQGRRKFSQALARYASQRQVEPAALGEQGRGAARMRSTPWKARRAGPPSTSASPDSSFRLFVGPTPLGAAVAEHAGVAERQRHDRGSEALLVAVLVQAHLRRAVVIIHQQASGGSG